ncbi:glutamate receptor ionotropic, kainate 2-like isoform X1 [Pollicipes pollicipes]|uniref:glutamate receptor ionotropic, kainate 2-like isoform X1 n=1 Tax=Pollicipes pollicipes TaxID=41117 RepID=UPI00188494B8|nr:glutamate receptor ionotropic, kainate 2-like isoform X1 [Pollicipes pollicipes]
MRGGMAARLLWLYAIGLQASSVWTAHEYGEVSIGALLTMTEPEQSLVEVALKQAVLAVNTNGGNRSTSLSLQLERLLVEEDTFVASKRVCRLFGLGVVAIFGPHSETMASHVLSMCDHKSVPVLETRWNYGARREPLSINLHPHPGTLSKALSDIIRSSGWQSFTVIYEDNQSLMNVQEVLKLTLVDDSIKINLQQLPVKDYRTADYRHILRRMRDEGEVNFVVDCRTDKVLKFLKDAQMVGMIIKKYSYFITSLDLQTLRLDDFRYSGSNITGVRLLDPLSPHVGRTLVEWQRLELERGGPRLELSNRQLTTGAALTYDAVTLLAHAIDELQGPLPLETVSLDCGSDAIWPHGESLINYMKLVKFDGLTGPVEFDTDGLRKSFSLDVIQLQEQDLVKIGSWSSAGSEMVPIKLPELQTAQPNRTIVVTTVMKKPYTMLKPSSTLRRGNDRFEGICVDLMDKLAEAHNFNYTLIVNRAGTAGKPDPVTGRWNGMIGDLLENRAHLAVADLTITGSRGKAINFTTQWMSLGISLVYTKPMKQPPSLFSFLSPFSLEVWAYMGMAMFGVSFLMFVLARFSPFEWSAPHPCHTDQSTLTNKFGVRNSFWFSCGSVMQQGSDILPQAMSTRMIAGIWWGFTLIMISSYTANLAAFLTIETRYSPIESADDLVKPRNKDIKYGLFAGGSTADFFRKSKVHPYNKMWDVMNKTKGVFRSDDEEGIEAVIKSNGKYAYFMESSSLEYYVARRCSLTQVGGLLDNKGYGIGVADHSPVQASELSETIIKLQEEGMLAQLKNRWWKGETGGVNCDAKKKKGVKPLSLKNVGGVFVCLIFGLSVATLVTAVEFLLEAYRNSRDEGVPFAAEVVRELRFVFRFRGNTKPVKRPVTSAGEAEDVFIPFSTDSSLQYAPAGFGFPGRDPLT